MTRSFPPIGDLVPHRGPMLLLDAVTGHEEGSITCSARIGEDHAFLEGGRVDVLLCVELVAQSVAAYAGYRDGLAGRPPRVGFLVSCREASFEASCLSVGDELTVETRHTWGDDRLGSFTGRVLRHGSVIAAVEIGVYRGSVDEVRAGP